MQTPTSIMLKHLIFRVFDQKSSIVWLIGPLGVKVEGLGVWELGLQQGNEQRKVGLVSTSRLHFNKLVGTWEGLVQQLKMVS